MTDVPAHPSDDHLRPAGIAAIGSVDEVDPLLARPCQDARGNRFVRGAAGHRAAEAEWRDAQAAPSQRPTVHRTPDPHCQYRACTGRG
jgi:hypothetical protein